MYCRAACSLGDWSVSIFLATKGKDSSTIAKSGFATKAIPSSTLMARMMSLQYKPSSRICGAAKRVQAQVSAGWLRTQSMGVSEMGSQT